MGRITISSKHSCGQQVCRTTRTNRVLKTVDIPKLWNRLRRQSDRNLFPQVLRTPQPLISFAIREIHTEGHQGMEQGSSVGAWQPVDGVPESIPGGIQSFEAGDSRIAFFHNCAQDLGLQPKLEGVFLVGQIRKAEETCKDAVTADGLLRQDRKPSSGPQESTVQIRAQTL